MSDYTESAERFARDTAGHQMTVLHDDGLYRHLRFADRSHGFYWFDLVTWPGSLVVRGDIDGYMFTRLPDMFEFFRGRRINPGYWSEKTEGGRDSTKEYSEDRFKQVVKECVADDIRNGTAPRGVSRAVRDDILSRFDLHYEDTAREALNDFEFAGYGFEDTWELDFRDWNWPFLWACHAIVWGIRRYDKVRGYGLQRLAAGGGS
ncbi:hypothetical protein GCM10010400_58040 [Streptomyces aculeolatus]|uniref:hypothetical protein n=1 Tax=Streptomyces aculeolatus TaxID=270689 RepID=UPI001CEC9DBC|nr:hypothetical protein [Streptomyces aculeolatus]